MKSLRSVHEGARSSRNHPRFLDRSGLERAAQGPERQRAPLGFTFDMSRFNQPRISISFEAQRNRSCLFNATGP
jgi:hypothetical protein